MSIKKQDFIDNMGGINRLYFVPLNNIQAFDYIYDGYIHVFSLEVGICDSLYVVEDSIKFSQRKKSDSTGTYYDTKLSAVVPKDRPEILVKINEMDGAQYVLIYIDNNGYKKVIGTPDELMNFSANLDTGTIEKLNGYPISFTRKLRQRSLLIESLPVTPPPPP